MPAPKCSEAEFIEMFESLGAKGIAERLRMSEPHIYARRKSIERRLGRSINAPNDTYRKNLIYDGVSHPGRIHFDIENGIALIGSDAHYWPDIVTTAHRAFVKFCKELVVVQFESASLSPPAQSGGILPR